ncbi:MAG: hypothetical protein IH867_00440 [Chloroflexi bacterium]|nr:hypothetical protein [Chloroflexota bacterium]
MNWSRNVSRVQVLAVTALLVALVAVACGTDDTSIVSGGGGNEDNPKVVRMVESSQVFTVDDMKAIGWKAQRDFVLEYPGTTVAKWGFLNSKEVGVLIYATAEGARTSGVEAANAQTFRREEDGQAPDENIDRISCRDAQASSAVKAITGAPSKAFSSSYLDPEVGKSDDILGLRCSNRYPTYNDYTVIGNMVVLCEGDGRNLLEPSTNCRELEKWLSQ